MALGLNTHGGQLANLAVGAATSIPAVSAAEMLGLGTR